MREILNGERYEELVRNALSGSVAWNPSETDCARAEARVRVFAAERVREIKEDYARYSIQFLGFVRDGKKYIHLNYLASGEDWTLTDYIRVRDGGSNYWRANYCVATNTVEDFEVNGEA